MAHQLWALDRMLLKLLRLPLDLILFQMDPMQFQRVHLPKL